MIHATTRFIEHLGECPFLILAVFFTIRYWQRHSSFARRWLPGGKAQLLALCGLLIAAVVPLREIWDLWRGNNGYAKAFSDAISWLCAAGLGVFGLYRFWRAK